MKEVLIYSNRKTEPQAWDVSTPALKASAFLQLFKYLDAEWQVYDDAEFRHKALVLAARHGDVAAAMKLLHLRITYEYEHWTIVKIQNAEDSEQSNGKP
jgi:hypothetical protein